MNETNKESESNRTDNGKEVRSSDLLYDDHWSPFKIESVSLENKIVVTYHEHILSHPQRQKCPELYFYDLLNICKKIDFFIRKNLLVDKAKSQD